MSGFKSVDWQQLLHELDWGSESRREEVINTRLKQRAEQYAAQTVDEDIEVEADYTTLSFRLGNEHYAVDVMLVRHVRTIDKITPVPGTPAHYPGVVNIRGKIVTVLDLRRFFDIEVDESDPPEELIVVSVNALEIGVLANHVSDIVPIYQASLDPLEDVRYARGMAAERLVFLDFARLFEDERLIVGGLDE